MEEQTHEELHDEAPPPIAEDEPEEEGDVPRTAHRRKPKFHRSAEASEKATVSAQFDLDEYNAQFDWGLPGMRSKLTRTAPGNVGNVPTRGHVETKDGSPHTLSEITERFGGGSYRVAIVGPRELGGMIVSLGTKTFDIAGTPKISDQQSVVEGGHLSGGRGGNANKDEMAPQAQAAMVGLLGKSLDRAYEGRSASSASPDLFREMRESVEASARAQVEALKEAGDRENRTLREQLNALREENEMFKAELRTKDQEVAAARTTAGAESTSLIATLIPTFSEQANQRASDAVRDANERVARMQQQYATDMAAADQRMQMQVENLKTMFQAQSMNQQTMFEGRVQQLQGEIQLLRTRNGMLEAELRSMRERNTELLVEQGKKHDPLNILEQASKLHEASSGLFGGGGGDGMGLSDEAGDGLKVVNNLVQAVSGFAPVIAARLGMGGPQQAPQQMPPQMMQQAQPQPQRRLAMPRQISPQRAPQQAPQAPQPRPQIPNQLPPRTPLRREELVAGVTLLNSAFSSGVAAEKAADTASQTLDRPTMRELVRRKPQAVYASLEANGILQGPLASPEGAEYLASFLRALRSRLSSGTAPVAMPVEAQPEEAPPEE